MFRFPQKLSSDSASSSMPAFGLRFSQTFSYKIFGSVEVIPDQMYAPGFSPGDNDHTYVMAMLLDALDPIYPAVVTG